MFLDYLAVLRKREKVISEHEGNHVPSWEIGFAGWESFTAGEIEQDLMKILSPVWNLIHLQFRK